MACDPPGWHREITEWAQRYGDDVVIAYPTHVRKRMAEACSRFYVAVVNDRLTHDGDSRLARHVANAVVKDSPEGQFIVKPNRASPRKIDLAVAAVVAFDRAQQIKPTRRQYLAAGF
jgi:phage terminase large subunit-like protein